MKETSFTRQSILACLPALVHAACMTRPLVQVDPQTESYVKEDMTQVQFSGVDILVMVDNSQSMSEEQATLRAQFPALIRSLLDPPVDPATGQPTHVPVKDIHVGVVSSDMGTGGYTVTTCDDPVDGDDGVLQHAANPGVTGCDPTYASYLSYDEDPPDPSQIDWISTGFGCIATLGTDGCGFEQQLKAVRRALVDHDQMGGPNVGFLRPDSILTILWVTDEEGCSVADRNIFDPANSALGHLNVRCFLNPWMVESIDAYEAAFDGLRSDPQKLVLAFIVGVPQDPACEGFGDELGSCLAHPAMLEQLDPMASPPNSRLVPSCRTATGEAYPPTRFVNLAQRFGDRALVRSICTDNFEPAIRGLTDKLHEIVDRIGVSRELATSKDPANPCRCVATCSIIEELVDIRECPAGRPCYRPEGAGTACATSTDDGGMQHSLCVIPQAGTLIAGCDPSNPPDCNAPGVVHGIDMGGGGGWYYIGRDWTLEGSAEPQKDPMLSFTEGMTPDQGSNVYIQCESSICPDFRQCGTPTNPSAVCCGEDEFCDCDPLGPVPCGVERCMPRPR